MTTPACVSIVVNNYNYGKYLAQAIDSALEQTYPYLEVIVVDDGSTDDSLSILQPYRARISAFVKRNGGQASALNLGYAQTNGDIVIFLDADDYLHPTIVDRVVRCFQAEPDAVRVQYRLAIVDAASVPTGEFTPSQHIPIPAGDLRRECLLFGDDIPWLPTSGNAFSRIVLQHIFPIPEHAYRICADYYLSNLSPLFGPILSIEETGGYYRTHGANRHRHDQLDLTRVRDLINRTLQTHRHVQTRAESLGLCRRSDGPVGTHSLTFAANRLVSLRLHPAQHPVLTDTRLRLTRQGIVAAMQRSDVPHVLRALYICWFLVMAIAPKRSVRWLAEQLFYPDSSSKTYRTVWARVRTLRFDHHFRSLES